ncbi:MAG: DNA gyrase subunit A [Bacteroidetes bacterium CG12_big_fil_rev_8_21_14_0_65_60_17]|nr:MAG: DNA gyrase subunit A [Bacteroidetes bacterium CG12_big_fil_rev_8_21_14_0_65_60_17]
MEQDLPRILPINIEDEMKSSYIDYSMSVIVSRALPDVRDGLKPVHRRVLFGMNELGIGSGSAYKKSARIVGEVLGKYHPHGDSAVYDTMVRMAQEFSMRYPLVDGQGNFGSVDGDSAAAMRYTEARMQKLSEELLRDLGKETVDFQENFDGSLEEPQVLPAAVPNLLINGTDGIAVGMATKIPPHNLAEAIDATVAYVDNRDITIDELVEIMPAPDFPTGGTIYGHTEVRQAYHTGRGRVIMRAKFHEEEVRPGKLALIATEIPYQVNKATLIEKIALLARDKKIDGISDLRDESDRDGMRIVIELRKDAVPMVVQNQLFKYTPLQTTFGMNMVALVKGRPETLNLKQMIGHYVDHRHEVVVRRTRYDLRKAEDRAHILEGLTIALDHLDTVITIIRHSDDTEAAKLNLMAGTYPAKLTAGQLQRLGLPTDGSPNFSLTEIQAKAILELRLNRLTGLERQKIEEEYKAVMAEIDRLREILGSRELQMSIIRTELLEMKEKYADDRRTEIDYVGGGDIFIEDLIEDDQMIVSISHQGLIKRTASSEYEAQGRGGVGRRGSAMRDEDFVEHLFVGNNHDYLLFFTDQGQCFWLRIFEIPEGSRTSKGRSIRNVIQIGPDDRIRAVLPVAKDDFRDEEYLKSHYVVMSTLRGQVKKTRLESFSRPRANGIIAIAIDEDDELFDAGLTNGDAHVVLASSGGKSIRFDESDARPMGRNTRGVRGIALGKNERVVGMVVIHDDSRDILTVSAHGYGKRSALDEYRVQTRGGKGILTMKTTPKTGPLVSLKGVQEDEHLMISTVNGIMIRMEISTISRLGRNTQGVRIIKMRDGDSIADVTRIVVEETESPDAGTVS